MNPEYILCIFQGPLYLLGTARGIRLKLVASKDFQDKH